MIKIILSLILISSSTICNSQSFIGAWEANETLDSGQNVRHVVIFADGYQVLSTYDSDTGEFITTNGGTWSLDGDTMTEKVEFHTENPEMVGTKVSFQVFNQDTIMGIVGTERTFKRIDSGKPGDLKGAWLISSRVRNGETHLIDTNRPRKTMKILSGTRFQWIAYNTETKEFMGTGGGTYTTERGKYTENIEFFSRDNSRVGATLEFNYDKLQGDWHHSGKSSKGEPLYEIWTLRNQ